MEPLYQSLFKVLADLFVFSQKSQAFHWNVTSPTFFAYHGLFGRVYDESSGQIDRVAEHIRSLGSRVPATFAAFLSLSSVKEGVTSVPAPEMVATLLADARTVSVDLQACLAVAAELETPGGEATVQVMGDLLELFGTFIYLLSSSL
jgi:starvation-inducible DNA-binding protein